MATTEEKKVPKTPKINIRFLYIMCNDVAAMRHFYTDLIGLKEVAFKDDEEWGWLAYQCEGFQMMFMRAEKKLPVIEEWTWQPGYGGGPREGTSWGIEIPDEMFSTVVDRLRDAGVKALTDKPQWRQESYWGFSVMDPMGNTVEVYTEPKEKPESTEWPGK